MFLLLFWQDCVAVVPTVGVGGFPFVESSSPFTAPLSGSVVLFTLCVWYKCKCVKKLLKLTWFLQIPFCLDDPGQAGDGGSLPFGNWNNKFMSWLGNAFLVVGVKMLLKEILTNMWHILLHWHFLLPSFYVAIHLPRSFSSSLPSSSPPPKSTEK